MRRVTIFGILFFLTTLYLYGQEKPTQNWKKNEINLEVLGATTLYSLNYERGLYQSGQFEIKIKGGISANPFFHNESIVYKTLGGIIEPKVLYHLRNGSIELGLGYTYIYFYDYINQDRLYGHVCCERLHLLTPRFGYRIFVLPNTVYLGLAITPIISLDLYKESNAWAHNKIEPMGGFVIGWNF